MSDPVIVYGAYGSIGRRIVASLRRRGCAPVLAGRDAAALAALGEAAGLAWRAFDLGTARGALPAGGVLLNAAGPFAVTAAPLAAEALRQGCHYLDVGNEPAALDAVYALDEAFASKGLVALPAAGYGATASNCLLELLCPQVDHPAKATLLLAPAAIGSGPGTLRTMLSGLRDGCSALEQGRQVRRSGFRAAQRRRLPFGVRTLVAAPMGDANAAFRSQRIPLVSACIGLGLPPALAGVVLELGRGLLSIPPLYARLTRSGPARGGKADASADPAGADALTSRVWVAVEDSAGRERQAWMECGEGNAFTAEAAAGAALRLLRGEVRGRGALTPGMAFGGEWLAEQPGTRVHLPAMAGAEGTAAVHLQAVPGGRP